MYYGKPVTLRTANRTIVSKRYYDHYLLMQIFPGEYKTKKNYLDYDEIVEKSLDENNDKEFFNKLSNEQIDWHSRNRNEVRFQKHIEFRDLFKSSISIEDIPNKILELLKNDDGSYTIWERVDNNSLPQGKKIKLKSNEKIYTQYDTYGPCSYCDSGDDSLHFYYISKKYDIEQFKKDMENQRELNKNDIDEYNKQVLESEKQEKAMYIKLRQKFEK